MIVRIVSNLLNLVINVMMWKHIKFLSDLSRQVENENVFERKKFVRFSLDIFLSNKWLLLVVSCSALDKRLHQGSWEEEERWRNPVCGWEPGWEKGCQMWLKEENLFPLMYTLGHFRPQLHYLIFSLLCIVLSYPLVVLSCPVFADRQTIRDQTDIQTHALIKENG